MDMSLAKAGIEAPLFERVAVAVNDLRRCDPHIALLNLTDHDLGIEFPEALRNLHRLCRPLHILNILHRDHNAVPGLDPQREFINGSTQPWNCSRSPENAR